MLNISHCDNRETRRKKHAGLYEAPTQSVLLSIMRSIESKSEERSFDAENEKSYELQYLEWADKSFEQRRVWPIGGWMATVLGEELGAT